MMRLRSPARTPSPPPPPEVASRQPIRIRHPAYHGSTNILLSLPAVDVAQDSGREIYGVHFLTVHTACAIITGNRFDGWIAADRSGQQRIELAEYALLLGGDYWFHVPSLATASTGATLPLDAHVLHQQGEVPGPLDCPYPVVPTFRTWLFPESIPFHFACSISEPHYRPPGGAPATSAVRQRDVCCRLTADVDTVEHAHIIPSGEKDWFGVNNMALYSQIRSGRDAIDSESNGILLREDVHTLFDKMYFSIVPKPTEDGTWTLTAHVNTDELPRVYKTYHNKTLRQVRGVRPEYFFARFAWDLFPLLRSFLQGGQPRWLLVRQENGEAKAEQYTASECEKLCEGQGRGRSASPSKTKRGATSTNPAQDTYEQALSTHSFDSGVHGLEIEEELEHSDMDDGDVTCESSYAEPAKVDRLQVEADEQLAEQQERRKRRVQAWEEEQRIERRRGYGGHSQRRRGKLSANAEDVTVGEDAQSTLGSTIRDVVSARKVTPGARSLQCFGQMSDESLQHPVRSQPNPFKNSSDWHSIQRRVVSHDLEPGARIT